MLAPSFENNPCQFTSALQYRKTDEEEHTTYYTINPSFLHPDYFHMFFPLRPASEEYLLFTHLKKELPNTPPSWKIFPAFNDNLCWFSFPKKLLPLCEKIAKTYNMTVRQAPARLFMYANNQKTHLAQISFSSSHVICLEGTRCSDQTVLRQKIKDSLGFPSSLSKNTSIKLKGHGSPLEFFYSFPSTATDDPTVKTTLHSHTIPAKTENLPPKHANSLSHKLPTETTTQSPTHGVTTDTKVQPSGTKNPFTCWKDQ